MNVPSRGSLNLPDAYPPYLSFDDAVDDGIQGFVGVARDHALGETRAPAGGLLHGHVQVVVGLLGGQVLRRSGRRGR